MVEHGTGVRIHISSGGEADPGLVEHDAAGRRITPAGQAFIDKVAYSLKGTVTEAVPGLEKY
jgi:ribosomal protein S19E (S16A)